MFLINFRSTIHSPIFKINESALPASFKRNVREQVFKKTISMCQNDTSDAHVKMTTFPQRNMYATCTNHRKLIYRSWLKKWSKTWHIDHIQKWSVFDQFLINNWSTTHLQDLCVSLRGASRSGQNDHFRMTPFLIYDVKKRYTAVT